MWTFNSWIFPIQQFRDISLQFTIFRFLITVCSHFHPGEVWGTIAERTQKCGGVISAGLSVSSVQGLRVIRLYNKQSDINKQNNILRHLRSCHAPVLLDRASDFPSPPKGLETSSLNTSCFGVVEVLPTDGDTFSILIWTSHGDSSINR